MLRGITVIILLCMMTGLTAGINVQQHTPDRLEIHENESALWSFTITNNEFEPININIEFEDTMFTVEGYPISYSLNPGEDVDGYYLIGPCSNIEEDVELNSSYIIMDEGQLTGNTGITQCPITLNVSAASEEEPILRTVDREELLPVEIVAVSIFTIILLFLKRHFFLQLIPPLYNKVYGDQLFSNEWRNEIFLALEQNKEGLRMKDIVECTECNRDTARYHVRRLVKEGYIVKKPNKRYFHYLNNDNNVQSIETIIRKLIDKNPDMRQIEIADQLGISRQHTYYYMNKINNNQ